MTLKSGGKGGPSLLPGDPFHERHFLLPSIVSVESSEAHKGNKCSHSSGCCRAEYATYLCQFHGGCSSKNRSETGKAGNQTYRTERESLTCIRMCGVFVSSLWVPARAEGNGSIVIAVHAKVSPHVRFVLRPSLILAGRR